MKLSNVKTWQLKYESKILIILFLAGNFDFSTISMILALRNFCSDDFTQLCCRGRSTSFSCLSYDYRGFLQQIQWRQVWSLNKLGIIMWLKKKSHGKILSSNILLNCSIQNSNHFWICSAQMLMEHCLNYIYFHFNKFHLY